MKWLEFLAEGVCGVVTPLLLFGVGLLLLFDLKAFHLRHPLGCLRYAGEGKGKKAALRSFCMALGGTLGVGNISGVALALMYGGAGSLLWMWLSALVAMLIKYAEILLALQYSKKSIRDLPHRSLGYIWGNLKRGAGVLSAIFSVATLLTSLFLGGMMQSNAVAETFYDTFDISPILVGVSLFLLTIVVILGGGKRISSVTFALIPFATFLYIMLCLGVVATRMRQIPAVLSSIFSSGLSFKAAEGGVLGYGLVRAIQAGAKRGLLSNEAGCGTAPIAHATATDAFPPRQGIWGIFEVFVDTLLLCTLTGFAVLLAFPSLPQNMGGMQTVGAALRTVWGKLADPLLAFSVLLFAFATVICWSYYGSVALSVFTSSPSAQKGFRILFSVSVLLGATTAPALLWHITDILLAVMTAVNLYALVRHRRTLRDSLLNLPFLQKSSGKP